MSGETSANSALKVKLTVETIYRELLVNHLETYRRV